MIAMTRSNFEAERLRDQKNDTDLESLLAVFESLVSAQNESRQSSSEVTTRVRVKSIAKR